MKTEFVTVQSIINVQFWSPVRSPKAQNVPSRPMKTEFVTVKSIINVQFSSPVSPPKAQNVPYCPSGCLGQLPTDTGGV